MWQHGVPSADPGRDLLTAELDLRFTTVSRVY